MYEDAGMKKSVGKALDLTKVRNSRSYFSRVHIQPEGEISL